MFLISFYIIILRFYNEINNNEINNNEIKNHL